MRHYEIVFLVHPDQSEQVSGMIERYRNMVTSNGGQVHRVEDWGRRILAYMVDDVHKAHYALLNIECDASTLAEIEGHFRFNDSILRHMIIRRKEAIVEQSPILAAKIKEDEAEKLSRERKRREDLENQGDGDSEESEESTAEEGGNQESRETATEENAKADKPAAEEGEGGADTAEQVPEESEMISGGAESREPPTEPEDTETPGRNEEEEAK